MTFLHNTMLLKKLGESLKSVLSVAAILFLLCFSIVPVPNSILMCFVIGTIMLIVGMGLFTLGTDLAMTPIGEYVGSAVSRSRRLWLIIAISLVVGVMITISEPDLHVLAQQVPNIPNGTIILAVSLGVGVARSRSDEKAREDSFGLVALCSIGPVIAVLLLGIFYSSDGGAYIPFTVLDI